MIFDLDKRNQTKFAAIDDSGNTISYDVLCSFAEEFSQNTGGRTLIFILSDNTIGSFAGYVACLSHRIVPLILSVNTDKELLQNLANIYKPQYFWVPEQIESEFSYIKKFTKYGFSLLKTRNKRNPLYDDLALLLPTSGSTGSPKLVRHSYSNILSNAHNVATLFEITSSDRPIAILPMHYTMGLSVITSHLSRGATILLIKKNLTDKAFWDFIKVNKATSFTGVSFSFEVLHRLRIFRMDLPHLKIFSQGGGKLRSELFIEFAKYAQTSGKKFIATYGQTEGTARMAYLPAELATTKTGSIGMAIPNGKLWLIDNEGNKIEKLEAEGQMVYSGPNVTLGYAHSCDDLLKGDENNGILFTGDIAKRDADGCYFIVGRMKRFLKIYGFRLSLDEVEDMIKSAFNIDCVCTGNDDVLEIIITKEVFKKQITDFVAEKTGLFHMAIKVSVVQNIPKNEIGKTLY
jgi:long-chain acyl-CoA synthetase